VTKMLGSISSVAEANVLLQAGVDIIDIKDPVNGALGAVSNEVIMDIVQFIGQRRLTSATIGDIKPHSSELLSRIHSTAKTGVDFVKVGLFDESAPPSFIEAITRASKEGVNIVIVLFAEFYSGWDALLPLFDSGIKGIMLDTCKKNGRSLLEKLEINQLSEFVCKGKQGELMTGLAGSLKIEDIPYLLRLNPDYLGFRGALCQGQDRVHAVDKEKVGKIRLKLDNTFNQPYQEDRNSLASA